MLFDTKNAKLNPYIIHIIDFKNLQSSTLQFASVVSLILTYFDLTFSDFCRIV